MGVAKLSCSCYMAIILAYSLAVCFVFACSREDIICFLFPIFSPPVPSVYL